MSFMHIAFPPNKDAINRKSTSSESTEMSGLVFGEESGADFWPIQHPIEPGEKPVECPLPHSSVINEWRVSRRKVAEPTSKRRHSVSHDGDSCRSFLFLDKSQCRKSFSSSTNLRPNHFRRH